MAAEESAWRDEGGAERRPAPAPPATLAEAVRALATASAEAAHGGVALVFEGSGKTAPRLRAAAGFATQEAARDAARALVPAVRDALERGAVQILDALPHLSARAPGGGVIHPLAREGHVHGALVVGGRAPLEEGQRATLARLADDLAVRFDHARLVAEVAALEERLHEKDSVAGDRSEEVLKLSEALFAQDIELLRNNEKLGKIEKLKSDFIEKMSRELRTPLNSIIESIIAVLTGENDALSDTGKANLRSALDDGTSFLRTLQNILDLWRIKQAELPVEIGEVNFRETVDEAVFSLQDVIGQKPLEIVQRLDEPFPRLRTDVAKLNQVLFLLLDNAAKFTNRGAIEVIAHVREGRLRCSIRDSGVGICPDDQQFVFDEFYQVDETGSQRYRGAGLGLALVRDLVTLLEGEIALSSEVGRGTTVTFEIPVQVAS